MNPYRGDFQIKIGDKDYTLRPDFEAMVEYEERVGPDFGPLEVLRIISTGGLPPIKVVTAAIWSGVRGTARQRGDLGQAPSFESLGQRIQSSGLPALIPDVAKYLSNAIASDDQIKHEESRLGNGEGED